MFILQCSRLSATNNGSAFFIDTGSRIFGVTAEHVVQGYLNDKEKAPRHIICQLGTIEAPFDLEGRLVGRGTSAIDIATFEVTRDELAALDKQAITLPELSLPAPTSEGAVFIVGFPGSRRLWLGRKTLSFGTFGWCGPLTTATSTQLSVAFEREFWVPTDASSGPAPKLRLGGLSGGPNETARYCTHIGITPADLEAADDNIGTAFLRHYTTADGYNLERAGKDLATYPPIAARLREMQQEDQNRKERHAAQERAGSKRRRNGTAGAQSAN